MTRHNAVRLTLMGKSEFHWNIWRNLSYRSDREVLLLLFYILDFPCLNSHLPVKSLYLPYIFQNPHASRIMHPSEGSKGSQCKQPEFARLEPPFSTL